MSGPYPEGVRISPITGPDPLLEQFYRDVLVPSFPPAELGPPGSLIGSPDRDVRLAVRDGQVLGGAVGDWNAHARVVLLSYLAIRPGTRGLGIGGTLLDDALQAWQTAHDPCLILAEVEDPEVYTTKADGYGDPAARLRFYLQRGARVLDLPYFQPALGPGGSRVPGLLLMVLYAAPSLRPAPDVLDPAPVRAFFEDYQRNDEGRVGDDPASMAMWQALERPGGVRLR